MINATDNYLVLNTSTIAVREYWKTFIHPLSPPAFMFSSLSSFLPSALQVGTQDKDRTPLRPSPDQISPPQLSPTKTEEEMTTDDPATKKRKERTHEARRPVSDTLLTHL